MKWNGTWDVGQNDTRDVLREYHFELNLGWMEHQMVQNVGRHWEYRMGYLAVRNV